MSDVSLFIAQWWNWIAALSLQLSALIVLISVATFLLKKSPPRVRHTLWLLVLVKVFLPPSWSTSWSLGSLWPQPASVTTASKVSQHFDAGVIGLHDSLASLSIQSITPPNATLLYAFCVWGSGVVIAITIVAIQYWRLKKMIAALPVIDEGHIRVTMESAAIQLGLSRTPELRLMNQSTSPFLMGVFQPCIVISKSIAESTSSDELRTVFLHELMHWKQRDTWIGWWQVLVQCLLWFHPLVWFAGRQISHEREMVCDTAVLQCGDVCPQIYGETLVRALTVARGHSLVAGGLVGVFGRGSQIQNRLESVMQFKKNRRNFVWCYVVGIMAFSMLCLPMAPHTPSAMVHAATPAAAATVPPAALARKATPRTDSHRKKSTPYPQIVDIQPPPGSTSVDPGLKELKVTFDRDMSSGMSWTGGGEDFPPVDKSRKARWIGKRTCVLPVRLVRAKYYRIGINSRSYQNFKATNGVPVPPSSIFFTTRGATKALQNQVRIPQIVKIHPKNNATDVSAGIRQLSVTFDMPMGAGMSWTGGGEKFPTMPKGVRAKWSADGRTCTLPVALQANHDYSLGLNSHSHQNFQSKWGVPLSPFNYRFGTGASTK